MTDLPYGSFAFYGGIDPGQTGGLGIINAAGTTVRVWDMPLTQAEKDRQKEIDLGPLWQLFSEFKRRPGLVCGLEWPTTRPGEGAERSERFGRGKGLLEAFAFARGLHYVKLPPNLWKGRLGLPGKDDPRAVAKTADILDRTYPAAHDLIRGPRGGLRSGRVDALAIAHFLRGLGKNEARTVIEQHGRGSDEAIAFALGAGRKNKRPRIKT